MKYLLLVLLLMCGCATHIESLDGMLRDEEVAPQHMTVDAIYKHYLTDEAYGAAKDIKVYESIALNSHIVGTGCITSLLGIHSGIWPGDRAIILPYDRYRYTEDEKKDPDFKYSVGIVETILHEIIHHLDDMTRDGEGNFIDYQEFEEARRRLASDYPRWVGIYLYVERKANNFWTDTFGIGRHAEHIAYCGEHVAIKDGPLYLKRVYRKILRRYENL